MDMVNYNFSNVLDILYMYEPLWCVNNKEAVSVYEKVIIKKPSYIIYISGVSPILNESFFKNMGYKTLSNSRVKRFLGWYGNYTISFWIKMVDLSFSGYFYTESNRGPSGCARVYSYINSNGTFTYNVWDNSSFGTFGTGNFAVTTTTNVRDGNWHQITCIWSNGNSNRTRGIYVYCDGVQEAYTDMIGNDGSYASMHLGGASGCVGEVASNSYLGPILQYNNVALTNNQVQQNYNAHAGRFR
jgi:hypothetical protein